MNNPRNWSDDEIRDYFDRKPNLRMQHLARMVGKSMPELKRILMPGRRQAGGGAGVTVALSGSWNRGGRTNLRPDFVGELEERKGQSGKLQGKITVEDVSIASYENSADVKGVVGYLTNVTYSPNDLREYYDEYREEVEDLGLSVKDIYLSDVEVYEMPNYVLSKGWVRAKAPNSFEVELELQGTLNAGNTELGYVNYFPGEAVLVTSTKFKDAYNHIDDWDEMDVDDARYMSARKQAAPAAPRFNKEDAENWADKRKGDISNRLKTTQVAFDHRLRELPKRGNPKHFEWGFEDWWSQAQPALEMPKDRYYVLGFLYADDFGRERHPEWDGRLASAKRVASRFMEAYRSERVEGPGGLIFTWDGIRGGLGIRTQAEDPYGQVYSSTITLSNSGKLALKALGRMWADPKMKREILSKRKPYDAVDFIDRTISEMGVRGRLKWHTKHYPD